MYRRKILLNVCSNDANADLGRRNMAGKSALLEENAEIGRQKVARKTATNKGNTDLGRQKEPRWSASIVCFISSGRLHIQIQVCRGLYLPV